MQIQMIKALITISQFKIISNKQYLYGVKHLKMYNFLKKT